MGLHYDTAAVGAGFAAEMARMSTDQLFDLADAVGFDYVGAPASDTHEWLRQRIFDHLSRPR